MANIITQEDLALVLSQSAAAQTMKLKIEVLDADRKIIGTLEPDLTDGSMSINGESDIRRTAGFTVQPTIREKIKLAENSLLWLDKDIRMSVGLFNRRTGQYHYYPLGTYICENASGTCDAASDNLSVSCSDFTKKLDGTKNGQLGSLLIRYPAYEENETTGEVIRYNTIRNAVIETLEKLAHITSHRIDDIGEYKAFPEYNDDWQKYRNENITWNAIPYDLDFSAGCSVFSILTAFRDLYPNYEMFFDMEQNHFVCQLKPMCYEDSLFLDDAFLQKILISENTSVDMTAVRNICEIWGKVIETDFYSEECTFTDNTYTAAIAGYENNYASGDIIGLKIPAANQAAPCININGFGPVSIYSEADEKPLTEGTLLPGAIYAFQIKKNRVDGQDVIKACLLGQWQVHALNVLTNGRKSGKFVTGPDGKSYELYSRQYFQKFYNCERVELTIIPDSPFTVEKLGEILDVKTGGEYENITSDDLAADRAKWENWKNSRLTDNITITTAFLPFLDVNKKVSYRPSDSDAVHQYIISSVSHDFSGFTSTITMYRFYPLYEKLVKEAGTHRILSEYIHGSLSRFTHRELVGLMGKQGY